MKKTLVAVGVLVLVVFAGLFFWVRAVFTEENVRLALAGQLSEALGQPVAIGTIAAGLYPRVTVNLGDVTIGKPARITIQRLQVGASLRALISRRIERADMRLTGARIELPLPPFALGSSDTGGASGASPPVEIVSIDEIVLRDVEVVSGGQTLRADVELVPQGSSLTIRRAELRAQNATVTVTGQIADLSGPTGALTLTAGELNLDELLVFASAFAGDTRGAAGRGAAPAAAPMNISMSMSVERAKLGALRLDRLEGRARVSNDAVVLEPIGFGVFGGTYDGTLTLTTGKHTGFQLAAALSEIDMAAAMKFAAGSDTLTGRLTGKVSLSGSGLDAASVLRSAGGTSRVDISNGTVKNLGLVRTIVIAGSGRSDAAQAGADISRDERFSRLGATLAIGNGLATTNDLKFESNDLLLNASGNLHLDGSALNLAGKVQLSDELASRAGRDLVRYTQEQGRPTLPVSITGPAENPRVALDIADVLRRAATNKVKEEAAKTLKERLGGLFKR